MMPSHSVCITSFRLLLANTSYIVYSKPEPGIYRQNTHPIRGLRLLWLQHRVDSSREHHVRHSNPIAITTFDSYTFMRRCKVQETVFAHSQAHHMYMQYTFLCYMSDGLVLSQFSQVFQRNHIPIITNSISIYVKFSPWNTYYIYVFAK